MNWKDRLYRLKKRSIISILIMVLLGISVFFLYVGLWDAREQEDVNIDALGEIHSNIEPKKEITHQEISPDGQKKIVRYELGYIPQLFASNYVTYLDNKIIIAVTNNVGDSEREYYTFIGEARTGYPHWLGNNYVFFTSYCGTSCQGLMLLDVRSGQRWSAILTFLSNENGSRRTHFRDWFDKSFEFPGFAKKIHGEMKNNKPYLVFDIENEKAVEIGQKRLLFTGNVLEEVE
ncbi:MAG: hypothetical protein Q8P72_03365 [Candidatus Roizmanbacteria bacterium]|nr:hypothetical protein [Candidatus Roizmanbacteria bacterium]